ASTAGRRHLGGGRCARVPRLADARPARSSAMSEALRFELAGLCLRAGASPRGRVLFDGLSFSVEAGQRWVVLGPNGAGKSSLLAAMAGVFSRSAGRLSLQGRAIEEWRPE